MRALSITLFILGFFWAYLSLGFLAAPFMYFASQPESPEPLTVLLGFLLCVGLCINGLVGYWVWWGWLTRFRSGEFHRNYFKISLVHHGIWLLALPLILASLFDIKVTINFLEAWSWSVWKLLTGTDVFPIGQAFLAWIVVNIVVCAACIFRPTPTEQKLIE